MTATLLQRCARRILPFPVLALGIAFLPPAATADHIAGGVNGLFYGDGDDAVYSFLQGDTSGGSRGNLYVDVDGNTIYFALVVDESVNDNVCGGEDAYMSSAGWNPNSRKGCQVLEGSDHAKFAVECGANANTPDYDWQQDMVYPADGTVGASPGDDTWLSDPSGPDGAINTLLPPSYDSNGSVAYNWNNVDLGWDMTAPSNGGGTGINNWKSPDLDLDQDVNEIVSDQWRPAGGAGFLQNNGVTFWEWPIVYEFSFDASQCTGPLTVNPGTSHNSPAKDDGADCDGDGTVEENECEDVPFDGDVTLTDFGDAIDSYGTDEGDGGNAAAHHIVFGSGTLRLGDNVDSEDDGQPSANADADGDDEDGIEFSDAADLTGNYTVTATVTNDTGSAANLCGWIDFDKDGAFQSDEAVCVVVGQGADQQIDLQFTVPLEDRQNSGNFYARFRLTTDSLSTSTPTGVVGDASATASDGEVEDYIQNISALPVTLSHFESREAGRNIRIEWSTASETSTVGFNFWGRLNGEWIRLNEELFLNGANDSIAPQSYKHIVAAPSEGPLSEVAVSSVDLDGTEHFFGPFEIGKRYGEAAEPQPIPWAEIQVELDERMRGKGYVKKGRKWRKPNRDRQSTSITESGTGSETIPVFRLETQDVGMHRVTYGQLLDAGVDLTGIPADSIALTHKGEPMSRYVDAGGGKGFGPGGYIDFYAAAVDARDARYTDTNVYQVKVDAAQVKQSGELKETGKPGEAPGYYIETVERDVNVEYGLNKPGLDPWYEHRLIGIPGSRTGEAEVTLTLDHLVPDASGAVRLGLAGGTFFSGGPPDHNIRIYLNDGGEPLADLSNDGIVDWDVSVPVSPGSLREGGNSLRVEVPGVDGHLFDVLLGDTYAIDYPREFIARDNVLAFSDDGDAFEARGFSAGDLVSYAAQDDGLTRLHVKTGREADSFSARIPGLATDAAEYWVSTVDALHSAEVVNPGATTDLLTPVADYIIVSHVNFIDRLRAADEFIAAKQAQGYNVKVVDVADIYRQYGHGLPVPDAIRTYLQAQNDMAPVRQVLIVGGATSDPLDYTGQGSIDFVPTYFAKTGRVIHQTPSDGLLVDLHGAAGPGTEPDGVPDKSIGRWPVRTVAELDIIIDKTLTYQRTMASKQSALLVAGATDPRFPSFSAQTERVAAKLADRNGEPWTDLTRVFVDDFASVSAAQDALKQGLNDGHAVTLFSGHGSTSAWTFQGLLGWRVARELGNTDQPTLIGTMSCYTSYFVAPSTNTLSHQLLLSGGHGAALLHGAATLSNFGQNEALLGRSTAAMSRGLSAGEAVLEARQALGANFTSVITNWSVLGDPSLGLSP